MGKIIVAYATVEGQTEKIARAVAEELRSEGYPVELVNTDHPPATLDLEACDGIVVGAPVHASGYPRSLRAWVKTNARTLEKKPSAFFSVCLGVLQKDDPKVQADEHRIVQEFFSWSGWHPAEWSILAGALSYSQYGWLKKRVMKSIARKAGGDTDTSRDHEYTDWEEVKRFAHRFGARYRQAARQA